MPASERLQGIEHTRRQFNVYHEVFVPRITTNYAAHLNIWDYMACVLGAGVFTNVVAARPIAQWKNFSSFLFQRGIVMPAEPKLNKFFEALRHTRFWGPAFAHWMHRGSALFFAVMIGTHDVIGNLLQHWAGDVAGVKLAEQPHTSALCGAVQGAGCGLAVALLKHPLDVIVATLQTPGSQQQFSGKLDVIRQLVTKRKVSDWGMLYRGFGMKAAALAFEFGTAFSLYHHARWWALSFVDTIGHFTILTCCFWAGLVAAYPVSSLRDEFVKTQQLRPFTTVRYSDVLWELQKKKGGVEYLFKNVLRTRPLSQAVTMSIAMMACGTLQHKLAVQRDPDAFSHNESHYNIVTDEVYDQIVEQERSANAAASEAEVAAAAASSSGSKWNVLKFFKQ